MLRSTLLRATLALAITAPTVAQNLTTELFASGLSGPVFMTQAPGDDTRFFVVEQAGRIRVIENGTLLTPPFLNITGPVQSGGERGLLGLAFHPDYQNNGRFFVNYTGAGGHTRVEEYAVTTDPNVANNTPVQLIRQINQDFSNHNGGCIHFGPDGKLFVGMGDGGSANDPNGRAQSTSSNLGKMLRFDVDIPSPFVPADNPFVGAGTFNEEVYYVGLRNPWRWSFDRLTGDIYMGDVGQGQREEVSFGPAGVGGLNFGWRCMEGTRCTGLSGCTCNATNLELPIHEYTHSGHCSITGGYNYRGSAIPGLDGTYFFADYCSSRIWSIQHDPATGMTSPAVDRTIELRPPVGSISNPVSFAEDNDGEIYIISQNGRIHKIVRDCVVTYYCQAMPTSTGQPANITVTGDLSIASNNLVLTCGGMPSFSAGIFFYGGGQTSTMSGQGIVCVASSMGQPATRIAPALDSGLLGLFSLNVDYNASPFNAGPSAILAGQTWNFQAWFRDSVGGQATWNFSNAASVLFCP